MPDVVVGVGGADGTWAGGGGVGAWSRKALGWDPWICLPLLPCGSRWPHSTRQGNDCRRASSGGEGKYWAS